MKLKLDLHDIYNRGQDIDRALRAVIDEAVAKKITLVEIIPGKGSGQLKKRVLLQDGASPAVALHRLNRALIDHPTASRFCTLALATVSHTGDDLRMRLCLAGHPEPVLVRRDGSTELVGTPGDLVGVLGEDEMSLVEVDVGLAPGESLVFYTDGVTERRDEGRMFGQYGVRQTLSQVATASAQVMADTLEQAARSFVPTELRDDLAILVVQRSG